MNKDFVTYELAKKLNEKGFNEPCYGYYHCNGGNESSDAFEWLNDKCCESAAHSWGYEIEDLTEV